MWSTHGPSPIFLWDHLTCLFVLWFSSGPPQRASPPACRFGPKELTHKAKSRLASALSVHDSANSMTSGRKKSWLTCELGVALLRGSLGSDGRPTAYLPADP